MLDRLVEDGMVSNYADVIGVLRGLGLVIESSSDPYQGVVVETAIRAKRRLKRALLPAELRRAGEASRRRRPPPPRGKTANIRTC